VRKQYINKLVSKCLSCNARTGVDTEIDIFKTILHLRQQRSGFVQTPLQYKFIYVAVKCYVEQLRNPSSPSVSFIMSTVGKLAAVCGASLLSTTAVVVVVVVVTFIRGSLQNKKSQKCRTPVIQMCL